MDSKPKDQWYSFEVLENENLQRLFPESSNIKIYARNGESGPKTAGK